MTWVLVLTIWFNGDAATIHSIQGFKDKDACDSAGMTWQRELTVSLGGYKRFTQEHSSYACIHY
jgi:hypothetical protein